MVSNRIEFIIKGVSVTPRSVVLNRIEFIIKGVSVTHEVCGLEQD